MKNSSSPSFYWDDCSEILYRAKVHPFSYIVPVFLLLIGSPGILFVISGLVLGTFGGITSIITFILAYYFFVGLNKFIKLWTTRIVVTKSVVSVSSGWLSKSESQISVNRIVGQQLRMSILGNLFNYGSIKITAAGAQKSVSISRPGRLKKVVADLAFTPKKIRYTRETNARITEKKDDILRGSQPWRKKSNEAPKRINTNF